MHASAMLFFYFVTEEFININKASLKKIEGELSAFFENLAALNERYFNFFSSMCPDTYK